MCGRDQLILPGRQVVHRGDRQVELERLPPLPIVERHVNPCLRSRVQQPRAHEIGPDDTCEVARRDAVIDPRPRPAGVRSPVQQRRVVVQLVPRDGHVRRVPVVGRRIDGADGRPLGHVRRSHVPPRRSRVRSQVHEAVVRACPQCLRGQRRLGQREYRAVVLRPCRVDGDRPARGLHLSLVGPGQIGADLLPARPLVQRPQHHVRRDVQDARVMAGGDDGVRPLEAVLVVLHPVAPVELRPRSDDADLLRAAVVAQ